MSDFFEKKPKRITFRVSEALAEALAEAARRKRVRQADLIRDAIEKEVLPPKMSDKD